MRVWRIVSVQAKLKEQEEVAKECIKSLTAKCRAAVKRKCQSLMRKGHDFV